MPNLLRLSDMAWPCSRVDLERDNPATWFPPDLRNAHPLDDFGYALPIPTDPPEHNAATHWVREIAPVQVDDEWRQAWELVELPTATPSPNWLEFRQAIFSENGYVDAHAAALNSDDNRIKFAATGLFVFLQNFENTGNYAEYLQALLLTVSNPSLSLPEQAKLAQEFLGLAQRCNLPPAFIEAFQQAIIPPEESE